jgi:hypothetical protein
MVPPHRMMATSSVPADKDGGIATFIVAAAPICGVETLATVGTAIPCHLLSW